MVDKPTSLEIIAPTIEEAILKGLDELGLSEDAVDVEILDEGTRGLFGLGSRHARIRLVIKQSTQRISEEVPSSPTNSQKISPDPIIPSESPQPVLVSDSTEDDFILSDRKSVV